MKSSIMLVQKARLTYFEPWLTFSNVYRLCCRSVQFTQKCAFRWETFTNCSLANFFSRLASVWGNVFMMFYDLSLCHCFFEMNIFLPVSRVSFFPRNVNLPTPWKTRHNVIELQIFTSRRPSKKSHSLPFVVVVVVVAAAAAAVCCCCCCCGVNMISMFVCDDFFARPKTGGFRPTAASPMWTALAFESSTCPSSKP